MQAVILAAGKGTRMEPLTLTRPKVLLKVAGKTMIEHNLEQLVGLVNEVIIVIGYKGEMIRREIGDSFKGIKVKYVWQRNQNGPGGALMLCAKQLKDRFIVLNGDDFYSKKDIKKCLKFNYCVMGAKVKSPEKWGIFTVRNGKVVDFIEKSRSVKSRWANVGIYVFDTKIFNYKLKKSKRNEYEITDYVLHLIKTSEVNFEKVSGYWMPIGYPWHILEANEFFLKKVRRNVKGKIEKGAQVKGAVVVGKGTIVRSGSYIEGPAVIGSNCKIGPNCYIRPSTTLGDDCKVGNAVEVKNCVLFDGVSVGHLSYIGDSVIGSGVNLAGGTIVANLRHDNKNVKMMIRKKLIDSGRRKLGTIIGDGVKTGINTQIYPGRKLWPKVQTVPSEIVKKDKVK
ncbi:MAG: NTP transferase domain-containing protein [Nanoarchaeota archaeon]|nr:NTP transferase domain-containing protein [Nanoarchaeota archaeon]